MKFSEYLKKYDHNMIVSTILLVPDLIKTLYFVNTKNLAIITFDTIESIDNFFDFTKGKNFKYNIGEIEGKDLELCDFPKKYNDIFKLKGDEMLAVLLECLEMPDDILVTIDKKVIVNANNYV
jgi:hypothetical protein